MTTRMKTLEQKLEAEFYRRFRGIKGDVRESVERKDILNLGSGDSRLASPNPSEFHFLTDAQKMEAFREWLQMRTQENVLEQMEKSGVRDGNHYTASYIRAAYSKGVSRAESELRKEGIDVENLDDVFNKPVHSRNISLIYTRVYTNLEGITQDMDTAISRRLSDAMSQGWNPRKAASRINGEVDDIGINRSRMLARTEMNRAHNEASISRYGTVGVEKVNINLEPDACTICKSLKAGGPYTLDEAQGLLPGHPNCRCSYTPVTKASESSLRASNLSEGQSSESGEEPHTAHCIHSHGN